MRVAWSSPGITAAVWIFFIQPAPSKKTIHVQKNFFHLNGNDLRPCAKWPCRTQLTVDCGSCRVGVELLISAACRMSGTETAAVGPLSILNATRANLFCCSTCWRQPMSLSFLPPSHFSIMWTNRCILTLSSSIPTARCWYVLKLMLERLGYSGDVGSCLNAQARLKRNRFQHRPAVHGSGRTSVREESSRCRPWQAGWPEGWKGSGKVTFSQKA